MASAVMFELQGTCIDLESAVRYLSFKAI